MKIIKNTPLSKFINTLGYSAISLFGMIFCEKEPDPITINHESIHYEQQKELLFVVFFIWYFFEYVYHLIRLRNHWEAYYTISFEKEAYMNERTLGYLKKRKKFAWVKYLK